MPASEARPRKRLQLLFEGGGFSRAVRLDSADPLAMRGAEAAFREALRAAVRAGGCRSFVVGVHVEGPACDHEVGP